MPAPLAESPASPETSARPPPPYPPSPCTQVNGPPVGTSPDLTTADGRQLAAPLVPQELVAVPDPSAAGTPTAESRLLVSIPNWVGSRSLRLAARPLCYARCRIVPIVEWGWPYGWGT